jgi:hypothetical protein
MQANSIAAQNRTASLFGQDSGHSGRGNDEVDRPISGLPLMNDER